MQCLQRGSSAPCWKSGVEIHKCACVLKQGGVGERISLCSKQSPFSVPCLTLHSSVLALQCRVSGLNSPDSTHLFTSYLLFPLSPWMGAKVIISALAHEKVVWESHLFTLTLQTIPPFSPLPYPSLFLVLPFLITFLGELVCLQYFSL